MEPKYKTILEDQIKKLEGETTRQTQERAEEKGSKLTDRIMHYAYDHGIVEKGVKVGAATTIAYVAAAFIPFVPAMPVAALVFLGYGGKKFVYDPLFNKKKK